MLHQNMRQAMPIAMDRLSESGKEQGDRRYCGADQSVADQESVLDMAQTTLDEEVIGLIGGLGAKRDI
jgi:hypothetical protein